MFLSFIVPVYNVEKYLDECVHSLLDQDIPAEDYEIICVNDGSSDESLDILRRYEAKYSNIHVIDKENGGVATARNAGLDAARGEYIWFVDADDFIQRNFLKELRAVVVNHEIVDFGAYSFCEVLSADERNDACTGRLLPNSYANNVYVTRCIFQRVFLQKYDIRFDENLSYSEDSVFSCMCVINKPRRIRVDKVGYYFRYRKGSATSDHAVELSEKKLVSWLCATYRFKEMYEMCDMPHKAILADMLMANLWYVLYGILSTTSSIRKKTILELRHQRLFPYNRPSECTITKSYQTARTDIVGKIFDKVYTNMHRPWGYWSMWCIQKAIGLKHRLFR